MDSRVATRYIVSSREPATVNLAPTKAHADDAAFDLRAAEEAILAPGDRVLVNTGIAVAIPEGYAGLVLPRSGLALKHSITVLNAPGLIDPGYRGDIGVVLYRAPNFVDLARVANGADLSDDVYRIAPGDRIAQLMFIRTADVELRHSAWLPHATRGDNGFGSTGVA